MDLHKPPPSVSASATRSRLLKDQPCVSASPMLHITYRSAALEIQFDT